MNSKKPIMPAQNRGIVRNPSTAAQTVIFSATKTPHSTAHPVMNANSASRLNRGCSGTGGGKSGAGGAS